MAMSQIERQFGKGAIMKLSDSAVKNVAAIPTGALSLDLALGIGGVPRGRIVEIYGPESSGKTTLTLHAIAECQKKGGIAAFIDGRSAVLTLQNGIGNLEQLGHQLGPRGAESLDASLEHAGDPRGEAGDDQIDAGREEHRSAADARHEVGEAH